jgi:hypothetical protein
LQRHDRPNLKKMRQPSDPCHFGMTSRTIKT